MVGKVIIDMLKHVDVKSIVVAGHGPPDDMDVARYIKRYPNATVHAFEPQKDYYKACKTRYANEKRVHLHPEALSGMDGKMKFHVCNTNGWSSLYSIKNTDSRFPRLEEKESYTVPTMKLDSLGVEYINLLHLDVQGAEHIVLMGARELLQRRAIDLILGEAVFTTMYGGYPHSFYDSYEILAKTYGYIFVGWYRPSMSEWGRVHYCDWIFATPELVDKMEATHGQD